MRCQDSEATMRTKKQIFQDRIRRMVAHRDNPSAPVDAATMLHVESLRLSVHNHPVAKRMAWAMRLAAAKLEAWEDPAMLTRYVKISAHNDQGMAAGADGPPMPGN